MIVPSDEQLDALREIINIGVGKAAGMLNELTETHIDLQVPMIKVFAVHDIDKEFDNLIGQSISAVQLMFKGSFAGTSSLVFPPESAHKLVDLLTGTGDSGEDFNALKLGTLTEVGNILLNGVMGSLSNILGKSIEYNVPSYVEGTIKNLLCTPDVDPDTTILFVKTRFRVEKHDIVGDIIILFELGAFDNLLKVIDQAIS